MAEQFSDDRQAHGRAGANAGEGMAQVVKPHAFEVGRARYRCPWFFRSTRGAPSFAPAPRDRPASCRSCYLARAIFHVQNPCAAIAREGFPEGARRSRSRGGWRRPRKGPVSASGFPAWAHGSPWDSSHQLINRSAARKRAHPEAAHSVLISFLAFVKSICNHRVSGGLHGGSRLPSRAA
jgi:hypothetical protein